MDYIPISDSTPAGGLNRPPPTIPPEFSALLQALAESARTSTTRLQTKLRQATDDHGIDRQELLTAQRDIVRLERAGAVPSPTEYWQRSALPRASAMIEQAMTAIVDEGEDLGRTLDRFIVDVEESPLQTWATTQSGRGTIHQVTSQAIDQLLDAVPAPDGIHSLGEWWQRRLRMRAIRQTMPRLLLSRGNIDAVIGKAEMALLDQPPWCHGDRLLSAFELAYAEIRTQTELVVEGLTTRVSRRGERYLTPASRVTIELGG